MKKQGYGVFTDRHGERLPRSHASLHQRNDSADAFKDLQNADESLSKALAAITDKGVYQLLNTHTIQRVYDVLVKLDEKNRPIYGHS